MRTATLAAALLVSLAACGGDGGLSLTEPHQLDLEACALTAIDVTGQWVVEEWGCEGRPDVNGGPNCDGSKLRFADGDALTIAATGAESFMFTIGGESISAMASSVGASGRFSDNDSISVEGCADGRVVVLYMDSEFGDAFAAYAHRR